MKITAFALILLVYLLANFYVFSRIWHAMPPSALMRILLVVVAVITVGSFFVAAAFGEVMPISATSILYTIGSSWMFIVIYFVLVFLFQDLVLLINKSVGFLPSKVLTQFSKENWLGMLFTMGFITLLMIGGYMRYKSKERVYLPIQLTKQLGDSISNSSLRIVAIADLHLGYTIGADELAQWVKTINAENPDIILIAGDLMDNSLRPLLADNHAAVLKTFEAPLGVYACMGNHEYIGHNDRTEFNNFLLDANIKLLRDSYVEIDSAFYVVGRDDKTNTKRKPVSELISTLDKSKPIILLDHQPYGLNEAEENGIDVQFSGHTHKGQIWPLSIVTNLLYEIDHGYLKKGNTHVYVSSGLGLWGGKFRIGTHSEYVVVDINK